MNQRIGVFDGHSDLFTNVTLRRLNGETDVIRRHHRAQLQAGQVGAMTCCVWIDPPFTDTPTKRMVEILSSACAELREAADVAEVAYRAADIERICAEGKLAILLGMEGLSGLCGQVDFLDVLYAWGVRHAMLTWNEVNEFANGACSPHGNEGLTPLGIRAVQRMEELGMIVDVSHANEQTFWDICTHTKKPFIASHSNAYTLCAHARNLKDDQIVALAERGGVIGMNAWPEFIATDAPSAERLADHVDHIANLVGVDHIACGFDFCDYLPSDTLASFTHTDVICEGLTSAADVPHFFAVLKGRGYSADDLEKIAHGNMMRIVSEVVG